MLNSFISKFRNNRKDRKEVETCLSLLDAVNKESLEEVMDLSAEVESLLQKGPALPSGVRSKLNEVALRLRVSRQRIEDSVILCRRMEEYGDLDESELRKFIESKPKLVQPQDDSERHSEDKETGTDPDASFMDRFNKIVAKNISNTDLSVAYIASEMCVSRSGLFAKVKEATGDTPNNIITNARLNTAAKLLEKNEHPVSEICYMVGFSSPSYFSRCFDKHFGMTPHEWTVKSKK